MWLWRKVFTISCTYHLTSWQALQYPSDIPPWENNSFVSVEETEWKELTALKQNPSGWFLRPSSLPGTKWDFWLLLSKLRWGRGRCCAVRCQKEQNHHWAERVFLPQCYDQQDTMGKTEGNTGLLKNKKNHMKHMGRGPSVSSSTLEPAPKEQLHCCLPRQIRATMVPLWQELWRILGSLRIPLPVGHYQEIELQWLCRRGSWLAPALQDPCRQAAFPLGRPLVILWVHFHVHSRGYSPWRAV